jgi:cytochrome c oxidase cbb3-type subunit 3
MNDDPSNPPLLDHDADGIKEFDNQLPRWWVWLFYITIIFAMGYMLYFHVFHLGDLQAAEWQKENAVGEKIKAAASAQFESTITALQPSTDPLVLTVGKQIYLSRCAPCHRVDGGGLVGPNLCDDYWIHGTNYSDSILVIWNGVPAKGMITWKNYLHPDEITAVASYIYTFRGTHPPNPKPPENAAQAPAAGPSQFE